MPGFFLSNTKWQLFGKTFTTCWTCCVADGSAGKSGRWCRRIGLNPLRWERRRERHHQEQDHRLEERLGRSCRLSNYFLCIVIRFAHNSFVSGQIKTLAALLGFLRLLVSLGLERAISFICWEDGQSKSLKKTNADNTRVVGIVSFYSSALLACKFLIGS